MHVAIHPTEVHRYAYTQEGPRRREDRGRQDRGKRLLAEWLRGKGPDKMRLLLDNTLATFPFVILSLRLDTKCVDCDPQISFQAIVPYLARRPLTPPGSKIPLKRIPKPKRLLGGEYRATTLFRHKKTSGALALACRKLSEMPTVFSFSIQSSTSNLTEDAVNILLRSTAIVLCLVHLSSPIELLSSATG